MSMIHTIPGPRAILLFMALPLTGCTSTTEPHAGLDVSAAVNASVIRPGELIEVTVTAVNRGARRVTINANPCPGAYGPFVITTPDGEVVGPGEGLCALVASTTELAPGEQTVLRAQWDGDSQRGRIGGKPVFLGPGEYRLRGQILARSGRVVSAPVLVRIAEPADP